MNEIIPFDFNGSSVRVIMIDDDPWFVAKDVADILGYREAHDLTRRLDEDEVRVERGCEQNQRLIALINESGLYNAVIGSQKSEAKKFKKWVTSEVLPALRKTGNYSMQVKTSEELIVMLANQAFDHRKILDSHEERIRAHDEFFEAIKNNTCLISGPGERTVVSYAREFKKVNLDQHAAQCIGRQLSTIAKAKGIVLSKKDYSGKFAATIYPTELLNDCFETVYSYYTLITRPEYEKKKAKEETA